MNYFNLLLLAFVVVYVVDLSGFTDSWRGILERMLHVKQLRQLKPFDCSLCMTFWTCNIYSLCSGFWNIGTLAYICLLSFLTQPMGALAYRMKETINKIINYGRKN